MAGRTPGKRMAGVRIVTVEGMVPGAGAIVVRNLFRFVDGLPIMYLVGLVTTIVTRRNQRIGDLAAGTLLIYDDGGKSESLEGLSAAGLTSGISTREAELVQDLIDRWATLDPEDRLDLARRLLIRLDPGGAHTQTALPQRRQRAHRPAALARRHPMTDAAVDARPSRLARPARRHLAADRDAAATALARTPARDRRRQRARRQLPHAGARPLDRAQAPPRQPRDALPRDELPPRPRRAGAARLFDGRGPAHAPRRGYAGHDARARAVYRRCHFASRAVRARRRLADPELPGTRRAPAVGRDDPHRRVRHAVDRFDPERRAVVRRLDRHHREQRDRDARAPTASA